MRTLSLAVLALWLTSAMSAPIAIAQAPAANEGVQQLVRDVADELALLGKQSPALSSFQVATAVEPAEIAFSHGVVLVPNPRYESELAAWREAVRARPSTQVGPPSRTLQKFTGEDAIEIRIRFGRLGTRPLRDVPFHLSTSFSQGGTVYGDGRGHSIMIDERIGGPAADGLGTMIHAIVEAHVTAYLRSLNP